MNNFKLRETDGQTWLVGAMKKQNIAKKISTILGSISLVITIISFIYNIINKPVSNENSMTIYLLSFVATILIFTIGIKTSKKYTDILTNFYRNCVPEYERDYWMENFTKRKFKIIYIWNEDSLPYSEKVFDIIKKIVYETENCRKEYLNPNYKEEYEQLITK